MAIIFGKLTNDIYSNNDDFHIYGLRVAGGERLSAICHSTDHPKALKTRGFIW